MQSSSSSGEYIQVPKSQFYNHLKEHELLSTKCRKLESQLKTLTNISEVVSRQEQQLKLYKKAAQQYESAYVASEAKLSHLLQAWINNTKKKTHLSDIEIIENLLTLKAEDLYAGNVSRNSSAQKLDGTLQTDGSDKREKVRGNDLEEDSAPLARPQSAQPSELFETDSSPFGNVKSHVGRGAKNVAKTDLNMGEGSKLDSISECAASSDTVSVGNQPEAMTGASINTEVIQHLTKQNAKLLATIQDFKSCSSEGWKVFVESKQYESLVRNLRLEVASARIQNSELKVLLAAKQGGNNDTLTKKITQLDKQVSKLEKQLAAKHALLYSVNGEYEKLKADIKGKASYLEVATATTSQSGQSETEWQRKFHEVDAKYIELRDIVMKEKINTNQVVENLKQEKEQLEEKCKEYYSIIEEKKGLSVDSELSNVSYTHLREENEKLKVEVATFRHELETKTKDDAIVEAQMRIHQEDFTAEIEARKKERVEFEQEKTKLLNLVKSLEEKYNLCLDRLKVVERERNEVQQQFNTLWAKQQQQQTRTLQVSNSQPMRSTGTCAVDRMAMMTASNPPRLQAMYASNQGLLAVDGDHDDGTEEDSPSPRSGNQPTSHPYHRHQQQAPHNLLHSTSVPEVTKYKTRKSASLEIDVDPSVAVASLPKSMDARVPADGGEGSQDKLECPQCLREFKSQDVKKFEDHCKKCMM